jgi:hypothetical protein
MSIQCLPLPQKVKLVSMCWVGFETTQVEMIFVAALRSAGIPARLGVEGRAKSFDGEKWQIRNEPDRHEANCHVKRR